MAKKSSSVHIEEVIWDYIDSYKKEHNLGSRNTAIEWIILEHKAGKISSVSTKNNIQNVIEESEKNDEMIDALKGIQDSMPD